MQMLEMKGTHETPAVTMDPKSGNMEIAGRALTDNAGPFFKQVLEWLNEYAKSPQRSTLLTFKLEYVNPAFSKSILDMLGLLEKIPNARVLWYFHDEDEDMEETGEELAELVKVPFEFRTY
jgi:hypothetical protein